MSSVYEIIVIQKTLPETLEADARKLKDLIKSDPRPFEILEGRQIFHEAEGAEFFLTCKGCKRVFDGFEEPVGSLLDSFFLDKGEIFECPDCGVKENIRLCDTRGFAAGFLGLELCDSDPFTDEFVAKIASGMNSKVTVVYGHL